MLLSIGGDMFLNDDNFIYLSVLSYFYTDSNEKKYYYYSQG